MTQIAPLVDSSRFTDSAKYAPVWLRLISKVGHELGDQVFAEVV